MSKKINTPKSRILVNGTPQNENTTTITTEFCDWDGDHIITQMSNVDIIMMTHRPCPNKRIFTGRVYLDVANNSLSITEKRGEAHVRSTELARTPNIRLVQRPNTEFWASVRLDPDGSDWFERIMAEFADVISVVRKRP